jgi:hypothetical protein
MNQDNLLGIPLSIAKPIMAEQFAAFKDQDEEITHVDIMLPKIETPKRMLDECWEIFTNPHKSHTDLSEDEIKMMMSSLSDCENELFKIQGHTLLMTHLIFKRMYEDLELIARSRNIKDYPAFHGKHGKAGTVLATPSPQTKIENAT